MNSLSDYPLFKWQPPHDADRYKKNEENLRQNTIVIEDLAGYLQSKFRFHFKNGLFWMYDEDQGVWVHADESMIRNRISKYLYKRVPVKANNALISDVQRRIEDLVREHSKTIERETAGRPAMINFRNGMLNMATRRLFPHHENYYSFYQVPFDYDVKADCPMWKEFLGFALDNDPELIYLVQKWVAFVLSDRTDIHRYLHLIGPGGTGKSVFGTTILNLVGEKQSTIIDVADESDNFLLDSIIGKQFIFMDEWEVPHLTPKAEKLLKLLGAFGRIRVTQKYMASESLQNTAKLLVCSNNFPHVSDASNALFRRLIVLQFGKIITTVDQAKWFSSTVGFKAELAGIINWALLGFHDVQTMGNEAFKLPKKCEELIEEIKTFSNHIMAWAQQNCEFDPPNTPEHIASFTKTEDLFFDYRKWCDKIELNFKHRYNMITFSRKLGQCFFTKIVESRTNQKRGWKGISLIEQNSTFSKTVNF